MKNSMTHQRSRAKSFSFKFLYPFSFFMSSLPQWFLIPLIFPYYRLLSSPSIYPLLHVHKILYTPFFRPVIPFASLSPLLPHSFIFLSYRYACPCILATAEGSSGFPHILVKPPLLYPKRECSFVLFTCRLHSEL